VNIGFRFLDDDDDDDVEEEDLGFLSDVNPDKKLMFFGYLFVVVDNKDNFFLIIIIYYSKKMEVSVELYQVSTDCYAQNESEMRYEYVKYVFSFSNLETQRITLNFFLTNYVPSGGAESCISHRPEFIQNHVNFNNQMLDFTLDELYKKYPSSSTTTNALKKLDLHHVRAIQLCS
jgi:hypothetical protein